jgi:hypothetical protein
MPDYFARPPYRPRAQGSGAREAPSAQTPSAPAAGPSRSESKGPVAGKVPPVAIAKPISAKEWATIGAPPLPRICIAIGGALATGALAAAIARWFVRDESPWLKLSIAGGISACCTLAALLLAPVWSPGWWARCRLRSEFRSAERPAVKAVRKLDADLSAVRNAIANNTARLRTIDEERLADRAFSAEHAEEETMRDALSRIKIRPGCCERIGPQTVSSLSSAGIRTVLDVLDKQDLTGVFGIGEATSNRLCQWARGVQAGTHIDHRTIDAYKARRFSEIDAEAKRLVAETLASTSELERNRRDLTLSHARALAALSDARTEFRSRIKAIASEHGT